jgi:hypothetical protein
MRMGVKRANPFRGRWRIVSTSIWAAEDLDDLGPAQITFGPGQTGELNIVAISASVDYRVGTHEGAPIVEFSWEGDDDGHPTSGRGWARLEGRGVVGRLFIHQGDEAAFVAKRFPVK